MPNAYLVGCKKAAFDELVTPIRERFSDSTTSYNGTTLSPKAASRNADESLVVYAGLPNATRTDSPLTPPDSSDAKNAMR